MAAPDSPPQFDLFETLPEPSRHRVGRKPHVSTPEQMLIANELKAAGVTWPTIAGVLGVCMNTVARHYFPRTVASPPKGLRRHAPTPATCKFVRRAILGGNAGGESGQADRRIGAHAAIALRQLVAAVGAAGHAQTAPPCSHTKEAGNRTGNCREHDFLLYERCVGELFPISRRSRL
jgi:hypothetical protein